LYHTMIYRNTIVVICAEEWERGQTEHRRSDIVDSVTLEYMYLQSEHKRRVMHIFHAKASFNSHVEKLSVQE